MDDDIFQALTDKSSVVLESLDLDQYYGGLSAADEVIGSLGRAFTDATPEQRASFAASLTLRGRRALGRYALRAPMLALREREGSMLRDGLLVRTLLEQGVRDWRDDLIEFAPYFYVAQELGLVPVELFDEAATFAVPDLAKVMKTFGLRKDVTLAAFGWRRIETSEGPTLEMLGWGAKPSGAVVGSRTWDSVNGAMVRELLAWINSQPNRTRPN
jgi:hypothetical protein